MSEISLKSPHFKQRDLDTVRLLVKISAGNTGACDSIDLSDLTVTGTATGFSITGFEAASDVSLNPDGVAAAGYLSKGTITGTINEGEIHVQDVSISGTAGSRSIDVDLDVDAAAAVDLSGANIIAGAVFELHLPIKAKDF